MGFISLKGLYLINLIRKIDAIVKLKGAIFKRYNGDWQNMVKELDVLAQVSGASKEEISLYMKGLNSLSVTSRVKL